MRILISFLFVLLSFCPAKAVAENFALSGSVTNTQSEPLAGTTILLFANDSVFAASVCDKDGLFKINELPSGAFRLQASFVGYTTHRQDVELNKHVALSPIVLQEDLQKLGEVTVQGDRKNVVKHEAGSTTFFLSANARKQSISPYEALREIPKLKINVEKKSIETLNGRPTLVTVNGIKRNKGYISTLSAEDIEGAEIIETPDMQYMDGAPELTVVNLIVKPRKDFFTSGSIMPLFSPDFNFNYLNGSFAVGSEKASFYVDVSGMAIFDKKDELYSYTESGNIIKEYRGKPDRKFHNIYTALGGDWKPTDKDLFLLAGSIGVLPGMIYDATENGTISLKGQSPVYALTQQHHSRSDNVESFFNLLYERTISKDQSLKAEVANGIIRNKSKRSMTSESELMSYANQNYLKESRLLFNANINYKQKFNQYATMNVGSKTSYRSNDFDDKLDAIPTYNFQNTTEYIYADVAGNVSKFSYKAGLGLDMVFNNAAGVHHQYYNLLGNASLSYSFNQNNWTTLSGSRTRLSPSYTQMNPENTSVDSLVVRVGNPYLEPAIFNSVQLSYSLNAKGFYVEPAVKFTQTNNNIRPLGATDDNIYTSTFVNDGYTRNFTAGITARYNIGNIGGVNANFNYGSRRFEYSAMKGDYVSGSMSVYLYYKKFNFNGGVYWSEPRYTEISRMKMTPNISIDLTYRIKPNWNVGVEVRDMCHSNYRTWTETDGYYNYSQSNSKSRDFQVILKTYYSFSSKSKTKSRYVNRFNNSKE